MLSLTPTPEFFCERMDLKHQHVSTRHVSTFKYFLLCHQQQLIDSGAAVAAIALYLGAWWWLR